MSGKQEAIIEGRCPNCGATEFASVEVPGDQFYLCSYIVYCNNCWKMIACSWGNR
jgi:hypothetical protein